MKISVITVSLNAEATIEETLRSVSSQTYENIEHILIDGASSDSTMNIVERYRSDLAHVISEPDKGIYSAMNKGISVATGDIIGFLNADDIYAHKDVVQHIIAVFSLNQVDALYGDLVYVDPEQPDRVVRYFNSKRFTLDRIKFGWMPAHPTLYLRKSLYDKLGGYRTDYRIASDFEFVVRLFWIYRPRYIYVPEVFVRMRMGGASTKNLWNRYIVNREMVRACNENKLKTTLFHMLLKIPMKIGEKFSRPV